MSGAIVKIYRWLFARRIFLRLNMLVHRCGLRGMGVMNYESSDLSGETAFTKRFVPGKEGFVVFDVGANVGAYSAMIRAANPRATIYAFEPGPASFDKLCRLESSAIFHPLNLALGSEAGKIELFDYVQNDGSSHASVYRDVFTSLYNQDSVAKNVVDVETLDNFVRTRGIGKIDLLKLDVEGHELKVLQGGMHSLTSGIVRMIHFEFNSNNVISRTFFKDFWDILQDYRLFRMLPDGFAPIDKYDPATCEIFAYQNIVAVWKRG